MALRLIWSEEAIDDVEAIAIYIEKDSIYYSKAVVRAFFEKVEVLIDFPMIGRIVPEYQDKNIRELFVYSYRLIYKLDQETIAIVAVIHGKRLVN